MSVTPPTSHEIASIATPLSVQIWADVMCPFCPIGDRRLQAALAQFPAADRVDLVYRSYRLQPGAAPEPIEEYLSRKFGSRQVVDSIQTRMTQFGAQEGLTYRLDGTLAGDTIDAHRLLHWAKSIGMQTALMGRLYRGYFSERINLFDRGALIDLAVEAGLEKAGAAAVLDGGRFAAEVEADQAEAGRRGIRAVPHFLIDDRISVSGAQTPAELLAALNKAWSTRSALGSHAREEDQSLACGLDACAARQER
jgi:predicted DsbA family dithiol-disulfide isomerase